MRSRDVRSRRSRRSLLLLLAVTALLGAGGGSARAQEASPAPTGEELFGAYELEARGQGVQTYYEIEGLLPGGSAILDFGLPEALARFSSGPSGYGVASLAYPGGLIVNLGSLLEQTGAAPADALPPYPVKEEAFYPTGPTSAGSAQPGGANQRVETGALGVEVLAAFPGTPANPLISVGSIETSARSSIEDGKAVSRTRVVAGSVDILGGVLHLDSVVTDLVAAHDGTTGATSGGTTVSGVRFLGLAATLTDGGLVLDEAPAVEGPGGALGDVLDPLVPGLQQALSPVQQALQDLLTQVTPQLDDLLGTVGLELSYASPEVGDAETGAASLISSGLSISLTYEGREQAALVELLAAIPDELKPSLGPIPNPVAFLAENHIFEVAVAPASVMALASPPFEIPDIAPVDSAFDSGTAGVDTGSGFGTPSFDTAVPELPPSTGDGGPADLVTDPAASVISGAVPALLVLLTMLAAPLFGLGSTRLADNVLAPVGPSCPLGLDEPPSPPRPA